MSKRKPMRISQGARAEGAAGKGIRVLVGHTLVLGKPTAGKTVHDLLRTTERELRLTHRKPADGLSNEGDEAWA